MDRLIVALMIVAAAAFMFAYTSARLAGGLLRRRIDNKRIRALVDDVVPRHRGAIALDVGLLIGGQGLVLALLVDALATPETHWYSIPLVGIDILFVVWWLRVLARGTRPTVADE
jgi:hypothetical protein